MENGKIKIWLPAIRTGTGSDVFTQRLSQLFEKHGLSTEITWYPLVWEMLAPLLWFARVPKGIDIIFANSWNGFAFRRTNLPLVVTLHHGGFDPAVSLHKNIPQRLYHRLLIRPYEKCSFDRADAITAVSHFAADSIHPHLRAAQDIHVIQNWVDTDLFRPAPETRDVKFRPFRLLFVGKLSRLKGAELLLPLMQRLGTGFELLVAGNSSTGSDNAFSANIRQLGWLNQNALIQAYQACDVLIVPSRTEGFSYTTLEAMACGKPVIASNVAALPELVTNGVNGWLCSGGNFESFATAVESLAHHKEKRVAFGIAARKKALEFSETNAMRKYIELIKQFGII